MLQQIYISFSYRIVLLGESTRIAAISGAAKMWKPVDYCGINQVKMRISGEVLISGASDKGRDAERLRGSSHAERGNQEITWEESPQKMAVPFSLLAISSLPSGLNSTRSIGFGRFPRSHAQRGNALPAGLRPKDSLTATTRAVRHSRGRSSIANALADQHIPV
jgi:hypothetical protein